MQMIGLKFRTEYHLRTLIHLSFSTKYFLANISLEFFSSFILFLENSYSKKFTNPKFSPFFLSVTLYNLTKISPTFCLREKFIAQRKIPHRMKKNKF